MRRCNDMQKITPTKNDLDVENAKFRGIKKMIGLKDSEYNYKGAFLGFIWQFISIATCNC